MKNWKLMPETFWQENLDKTEYHILRKKGTERAFSGQYWDHHEVGIYCCRGCNSELFPSTAKFDSGTGWPSFFQPVSDAALERKADRSLFAVRTEVLCSSCGGHLGHVFEDGPAPTGLRYCINSASLRFNGAR